MRNYDVILFDLDGTLDRLRAGHFELGAVTPAASWDCHPRAKPRCAAFSARR